MPFYYYFKHNIYWTGRLLRNDIWKLCNRQAQRILNVRREPAYRQAGIEVLEVPLIKF